VAKLPSLDWHQGSGFSSRKEQLENSLRTFKVPVHYSDITELLNDMFNQELDESYVYTLLSKYEETFILLGEGVFSLNEWEKTRLDVPNPTLPFCPSPLPDFPGQSDTFLESILVADKHLNQAPFTSDFLNYMLEWSSADQNQSNWFKQSILNAYYLVGLIPYAFHFEGQNPVLNSTLPSLELPGLRKYCVETLTTRLLAMPEFWWIIRQYQPGKPSDFTYHFVETHPYGLNDVINRLKILAGLGAIQRLSYGRYQLTSFGAMLADQLAKKPEFEDLIGEDKPDESEVEDQELRILVLGLW